MVKVLFDFWPYWKAVSPLLVIYGVLIVAIAGHSKAAFHISLISASVVSCLALGFWFNRRIWMFANHVRGFCALESGRISLRYSPAILDTDWIPTFLRETQLSLDDLAGIFRFSLFDPTPMSFLGCSIRRRRRLIIYVLADNEEFHKLFEPNRCATILRPVQAVVVTHESPNLSAIVYHELVHLFALRWNHAAVPLLSEGLAMFLSEAYNADSAEVEAKNLDYVKQCTSADFSALLDPACFYNDRRAVDNYVFARDFVAFLIRRGGWEKFRSFYEIATTRDFLKVFKRVYRSEP